MSEKSAGRVLIVGGTSAIARAAARQWAGKGYDLILAGRDVDELKRSVDDAKVRFGVQADAIRFDALDLDNIPEFFQSCLAIANDQLVGIVLCHGFMADQQKAQANVSLARQMIDTNYTSSVALLEIAAAYFQQKKFGFVCAVSSVAGDRGRQSNYLYGSTKAALTTYLQGLRNRLAKSRIPVVTVKPGFVDTAMTWGLPGLFLVASPARVAGDMYRAVAKGKSSIYTPWFWWGIMLIIKTIPEPIFKRMKL